MQQRRFRAEVIGRAHPGGDHVRRDLGAHGFARNEVPEGAEKHGAGCRRTRRPDRRVARPPTRIRRGGTEPLRDRFPGRAGGLRTPLRSQTWGNPPGTPPPGRGRRRPPSGDGRRQGSRRGAASSAALRPERQAQPSPRSSAPIRPAPSPPGPAGSRSPPEGLPRGRGRRLGGRALPPGCRPGRPGQRQRRRRSGGPSSLDDERLVELGGERDRRRQRRCQGRKAPPPERAPSPGHVSTRGRRRVARSRSTAKVKSLFASDSNRFIAPRGQAVPSCDSGEK